MTVPPYSDDDDDGELELEPVDPEVLALERARAQRQVDRVVEKVDVDDLYDDRSSYSDLELNLPSLRRIRFTTQHLLILTALLAIGLTLFQLLGKWLAGFLIAVVSVAAGWFWVFRQEARQEAERARRREEFHTYLSGGKAVEFEGQEQDEVEEGAETFRRFDFKFAFSMQELFITMTVAAVAVALLRWRGPEELATVLGLVAVIGLAVYAMGFQPPRMVVLGWGMLLVIYLIVSFIALLFSREATAAIPVTLVGS